MVSARSEEGKISFRPRMGADDADFPKMDLDLSA
jgi:hypothetical protein